jgi:hypothetical protein
MLIPNPSYLHPIVLPCLTARFTCEFLKDLCYNLLGEEEEELRWEQARVSFARLLRTGERVDYGASYCLRKRLTFGAPPDTSVKKSPIGRGLRGFVGGHPRIRMESERTCDPTRLVHATHFSALASLATLSPFLTLPVGSSSLYGPNRGRNATKLYCLGLEPMTFFHAVAFWYFISHGGCFTQH